jgi:hypothetical protein
MATPTNCVTYPVMGQAFNNSATVLSTTTFLPITAGLTSIIGQVSKNDGAFVNLATTPTEQPASSGVLSFDLSVAEMSYGKLVVRLGASGGYCPDIVISPLNLGQFTGRADVQSLLRFEQYAIDDLILNGWNGATQNGAAETYLNQDGSTHFSASISQNIAGPSQTATRTKTQ